MIWLVWIKFVDTADETEEFNPISDECYIIFLFVTLLIIWNLNEKNVRCLLVICVEIVETLAIFEFSEMLRAEDKIEN